MSPCALCRQVRQDGGGGGGGGEISLWHSSEATTLFKNTDQGSDGLAEHGWDFCIKCGAKIGRITIVCRCKNFIRSQVLLGSC